MTANVFPQPTDLPAGSQKFARETIKRIETQDRDFQSFQTSQTATNKGLAATIASLSNTVNNLGMVVASIPLSTTTSSSTNGFGVAAGWTTYAEVTVLVPEGKTTLNALAVGGAAALDTSSLSSIYSRIVLGPATSPMVGPASDAGASVTNKLLTVAFGVSFAVTPGELVTCALQLEPLNPASFPAMPGNYATINLVASFTA